MLQRDNPAFAERCSRGARLHFAVQTERTNDGFYPLYPLTRPDFACLHKAPLNASGGRGETITRYERDFLIAIGF